MRTLAALILLASGAGAQQAAEPTQENLPKLKSREEVNAAPRREPQDPSQALIVPAGTKIPLQLRQPISTKGAKAGDPIYAQTTFPIVVQGTMAIPAGTWVQGVVDAVKRKLDLARQALPFEVDRAVDGGPGHRNVQGRQLGFGGADVQTRRRPGAELRHRHLLLLRDPAVFRGQC